MSRELRSIVFAVGVAIAVPAFASCGSQAGGPANAPPRSPGPYGDFQDPTLQPGGGQAAEPSAPGGTAAAAARRNRGATPGTNSNTDTDVSPVAPAPGPVTPPQKHPAPAPAPKNTGDPPPPLR